MPENTWELLVIIAGVAVPAVLGAIACVMFVINNNRGMRRQFDETFSEFSKETAAQFAVMSEKTDGLRTEIHDRISRLQRELNDHRLHSAETFVTTQAMREMESRLDSRFDDLGNQIKELGRLQRGIS